MCGFWFLLWAYRFYKIPTGPTLSFDYGPVTVTSERRWKPKVQR